MERVILKREYLILLAGDKKDYSNTERFSAMILNHMLFKISEGYTGKDVLSFKAYLSEEKNGITKNYAWEKMSYGMMSEKALMGFTKNNNTIKEAVQLIIDGGYVNSKAKGYFKNSRGQIKSDKAFSFRVNLKKLVHDLNEQGLLQEKEYLKCSKFKFTFKSLRDKWLNIDCQESEKEQVKVEQVKPPKVKQNKAQGKVRVTETDIPKMVDLNDLQHDGDYVNRKADEYYKSMGAVYRQAPKVKELLLGKTPTHTIENCLEHSYYKPCYEMAEKENIIDLLPEDFVDNDKFINVIQQLAIRHCHKCVLKGTEEQLKDLPRVMSDYLVATIKEHVEQVKIISEEYARMA